MRNAKHRVYFGVGFLAVMAMLAVVYSAFQKNGTVQAAQIEAPTFQVDPFWPKPLPNHWILGQVIGVAVDKQDHVWLVQWPNGLERGEIHGTTNPPMADCCVPAPPVLKFDQEGNLIGHWGGPGEGYDWPNRPHGITVDYKGNVWIAGNGKKKEPAAFGSFKGNVLLLGKGPEGAKGGDDDEDTAGNGYFHDDMVLKFTKEGKFLLQIGKPGESKGSNDTANLRLPAKTFVDPKTNELYVADGYANHRVIVFDAETGKYKRHWGAYGHIPVDEKMGSYDPDAPPTQQFRTAVHCVAVANDGLVYVCDRTNDRIQVFKTDGTFVKEAFIEKRTLGSGSVWDITFSQDPAQKYIYLADGENDKIHILSRDTLEVLTSFGDGGRQPGEFYGDHSIASDSKGNIYTGESYRGQRIQKFIYKGLKPVTLAEQGVVYPKSAKQ